MEPTSENKPTQEQPPKLHKSTINILRGLSAAAIAIRLAFPVAETKANDPGEELSCRGIKVTVAPDGKTWKADAVFNWEENRGDEIPTTYTPARIGEFSDTMHRIEITARGYAPNGDIAECPQTTALDPNFFKEKVFNPLVMNNAPVINGVDQYTGKTVPAQK